MELDGTGQLVTHDGYLIQPGIVVPSTATSVTISANGQVQATLTGQTAPQTLGQLQLAHFINKEGLESIGDNLFVETAASGSPITGNPGADGLRQPPARLPRGSQRQRRDGDLLPHRGAARLRDERQGGHRVRPDALGHQPDVQGLTMTDRQRTLALLLAAMGLGFCATVVFVAPLAAQTAPASRRRPPSVRS